MNLSCGAILLVGLISWNVILALELNEKGGYHLRVGVVVQDPALDLNSYGDQIKVGLQRFSNQLYISTKEKFYIESVEIDLTRLEENTLANEGIDSYFEGKDIRIAEPIKVPYTENPSICGLPGQYIELPLEFFGGTLTTKTLLTLWARYRWGVWEEHGYPGTKFPYFFKERQNPFWSRSGCSDEALIGEYVNEYDETSEECSPENEAPPGPLCRFKLDPYKNNATTSLMDLNSLESVTGFCDEQTHDRGSPNRQNLLCNYQSVWEVLVGTPDYLKVTTVPSKISPIKFTTNLKTDDPGLYILLDKGHMAFSGVENRFTTKLVEILNYLEASPMATLGTYPSASLEPYVDQKVLWSELGPNMAEFENAVRTPHPNPPKFRNFGRAITEAAESIRKQNIVGGAGLFIIKTGAEAGSFDKVDLEEVVLEKLRNEKIKIFCLELSHSQDPAGSVDVNLRSFTEELGGIYYTLTPTNLDAFSPKNWADRILTILGSPIPAPATRTTLIYKGTLKPGVRLPLMIRPNLTRVDYRLIVPATVEALPSSQLGETYFDRASDWGVDGDESGRQVLKSFLSITDKDTVYDGFPWSYYYSCLEGCESLDEGQLLVYGTLADGSVDLPIQVIVTTSAANNILDFSETGNPEAPFTIFARATLFRMPMTCLTVTALITERDGTEKWSIPLLDNGSGNPDALEGDGIYSTAFLPPRNGSYRVTVNVVNPLNGPARTRIKPIIQLPTDQDHGERTCESEDCASCSYNFGGDALQTSADLPGSFHVVNRNAFQQLGRPMRVYTLAEGTSDGGMVKITFMTPEVLGQEQGVVVTLTYDIYVVESRDQLVLDFESLSPNVSDHDHVNKPWQEIFLNPPDVDEAQDFFIAITATNGPLTSNLSNIISVRFDPNAETSVPTTTESIDPSDTPSPTSTPTGSSSLGISDLPSTSPFPEDEDKPFFETGAGIAVIILIVVVGGAAVGGGIWYCLKRRGSPGFSSA